jgi:hypothetical protein
MIINARSPFIITVNESGQVGSKIELYLSEGDTSLPGTPNYTLSKPVASSTQISTSYNVSQFIREFIDTISPYNATGEVWANCRILRYKETSVGSYTLLDTTDYVGLNGYTLYSQGLNYGDTGEIFYILANPAISIIYDDDSSQSEWPYINVVADFTESSASKVRATYKDMNGRNEVSTDYDTGELSVIKIPVRTTSAKYDKGNTLTISWRPTGEYNDLSQTFTIIPRCEPKYDPVICQFINRYGGWQFLTFFKAKTNSIMATSTSYNVLPSAVDYDIKKPQSGSFNINGKQMIKLNTGWVPENYSELIQDLIVAETILLDDVPAEIKTQSTDFKTSLKDRNINYEIDFEYAFNLINNVI